MSGLETSFKIIDSLPAAKETGDKLHVEFVKNWVTSHNTGFFKTIKKSGLTYTEEEKKTPKAIQVLMENFQALGLCVSKRTDKKAAFHYHLTSYPLAIVDSSGKLY